MVTWMALAVLTVLLLAACIKIEKTQEEVRSENLHRRLDAVDFIDRMIEEMKARNEAALLRRLADKWDHPSEQGELTILAREKYRVGGPSMPAIWLREQADKLERKED